MAVRDSRNVLAGVLISLLASSATAAVPSGTVDAAEAGARAAIASINDEAVRGAATVDVGQFFKGDTSYWDEARTKLFGAPSRGWG